MRADLDARRTLASARTFSLPDAAKLGAFPGPESAGRHSEGSEKVAGGPTVSPSPAALCDLLTDLTGRKSGVSRRNALVKLGQVAHVPFAFAQDSSHVR